MPNERDKVEGEFQREKSFIKRMKDKAVENHGGNVLHKGDEGQSSRESRGKCPS
ncbi:hypothetical protein [Desertibacillus haloalkaliphilus]|uniref:hypothetical protein n=1 Tax=Desertibacillus haloalkaliphilus TaxID=1328930 RepID=UPI001C2764E1|nr:hypothetical protein [Desertibacillus haloalkaliphilus]MBU8907566.1 hypothetical protein [Desertibacillus haloalkaliphilus]